MEQLQAVVQQVIRDLEAVLNAAELLDAPLRPNHRSTIDLQLRSLRLVDGELHERVVTRKVWSLGEATVPVLRSMLNGAGKPRVGLPKEVVDRAQASVAQLRVELIRFAEGR